MPKQSQRAFFALRAFNVELASVKGSHNLRRKGGHEAGGDFGDTSTTVALEIRMQWWKDALGEIYGDPPTASDPALRNLSLSCWKSPIVRALDHANQQYGFTRRFLERLVEARALDLHVQQLRTLDESITYAEETVSSLLYLTLESVNVSIDSILLGFCLLLVGESIHLICPLAYWERFDKTRLTKLPLTLVSALVSPRYFALHPFALYTTRYQFHLIY